MLRRGFLLAVTVCSTLCTVELRAIVIEFRAEGSVTQTMGLGGVNNGDTVVFRAKIDLSLSCETPGIPTPDNFLSCGMPGQAWLDIGGFSANAVGYTLAAFTVPPVGDMGGDTVTFNVTATDSQGVERSIALVFRDLDGGTLDPPLTLAGIFGGNSFPNFPDNDAVTGPLDSQNIDVRWTISSVTLKPCDDDGGPTGTDTCQSASENPIQLGTTATHIDAGFQPDMTLDNASTLCPGDDDMYDDWYCLAFPQDTRISSWKVKLCSEDSKARFSILKGRCGQLICETTTPLEGSEACETGFLLTPQDRTEGCYVRVHRPEGVPQYRLWLEPDEPVTGDEGSSPTNPFNWGEITGDTSTRGSFSGMGTVGDVELCPYPSGLTHEDVVWYSVLINDPFGSYNCRVGSPSGKTVGVSVYPEMNPSCNGSAVGGATDSMDVPLT